MGGNVPILKTVQNRFLPVMALVSSLLLSGCVVAAGKPKVASFPGKTPYSGAPDTVTLRLADAADRAAAALEGLSLVEQARTPALESPAVVDAPPELRNPITVSWTGGLEPLISRLAARAEYGFETLGVAPEAPIIVDVKADARPLIDVLRDLGLQAGNRADVAIDPSRRVIEVRYAPNEGR